MPSSARDVAVTALIHWEREQTYSNIMLDSLLQNSSLSAADAAFTTRLVYGVIERLLTIDWILSRHSRQPLKKCHPSVRAILRVGAYQLLFSEKIPPSAAVNEAVGQTKRMKQPYASGFVNGVLRAVAREGQEALLHLPDDSVRYSVPKPLLAAWQSAYGAEMASALAQNANEVPPTILRVNTLKITPPDLAALLEENAIGFAPVAGLPAAMRIEDAAKLRACAIGDDLYYFQDTASQWACEALGARPGERIADVCAAPGGKSFTTAMHMNGNGEIVSCDIYKEKTATIASRAAHYGISCVTARCRDASETCEATWRDAFDRVICDVPCSGFGVIRRRPEIRYKSLEDFNGLPELQYRILCASADMVRPGGVLQYSTCTLRPEENEQVVSRFLREHPSFSPRELPLPLLFEAAALPPSHQITLLPPVHGTDGFFIASFRKEGVV